MKITIDRTKCDGFAKCVQAAPKVFRLDAKMIAEVIDAKPTPTKRYCLLRRSARQRQLSWRKKTGKRIFSVE